MKHNFLRFSALVLCLLMAVSLCACGGSDDETGSDASAVSSQSGGNTEAPTAHIVQTKYETADTVIAVLDVTDYGADPTGKEDSTEAIKKALSLATVKDYLNTTFAKIGAANRAEAVAIALRKHLLKI